MGYDFGNNIRAAVDYTHNYGISLKDTTKPESGKETTVERNTQFRNIGVSGFYDFDIEQFKPYLGARVGMRFNGSTRAFDLTGKTKTDGTKRTTASTSAFGVGAIVGVGYEVSENAALDAGYRFNYFFTNEEVSSNSHELSIGLRVKF